LLLAQSTQDSSWTLGPFVRPVTAPIITPNPAAVFTDPITRKPVHWEALHTFNPAAIVRQGKVYVFYRAEDDSGSMVIGMHTSRLGLASSDDGIHFTTEPAPVFYPDVDSQQDREWPGGVEDPRLVEREDGTYVLTYTQWNRRNTDIGIATSTDLIHWAKQGPALVGEKYQHFDYKSASIVTRLTNGRLIAAKIHGKYWMYWGEIQVRLATSPDLIHWTPVEGSSGKPIVLLRQPAGTLRQRVPRSWAAFAAHRSRDYPHLQRQERRGRRVRPELPPTPTLTDKRCLQPMILASSSHAQTSRFSSPSNRGNKAASMSREPPLPKG
jgi:sucrose-6-phosphate hydrolase SacC (GH32 family)